MKGRRAAMALAVGVAAASSAAEWRTLFNGRDLDGWMASDKRPPSSGWTVADGALKLSGRGGYIWTRDTFGDFELELEYSTEGNSGVFFRTENPRDPVQTGIEVQIHTPGGPNRHSVGALYDLVAPSTNAARAGWNRLVLSARGLKIAVELNGVKIIEADLDRWTEAGCNPDGSRNKFKRPLKDFARRGHIGFQDHGATVRYRNVRIRPLD